MRLFLDGEFRRSGPRSFAVVAMVLVGGSLTGCGHIRGDRRGENVRFEAYLQSDYFDDWVRPDDREAGRPGGDGKVDDSGYGWEEKGLFGKETIAFLKGGSSLYGKELFVHKLAFCDKNRCVKFEVPLSAGRLLYLSVEESSYYHWQKSIAVFPVRNRIIRVCLLRKSQVGIEQLGPKLLPDASAEMPPPR